MTILERWISFNLEKIKNLGIVIDESRIEFAGYVDGEIGDFMFRIIDRGLQAPDIEIIRKSNGDLVFYNQYDCTLSNEAIFDGFIKFIVELH